MTGTPIRLGVLDQAPISEGSSAADALRSSLDLAALADELGYARYWVAEHHATPQLACGSPEILIAEIAHATSSIRVGSGGVLLPYYSSLKVAETFGILSALHPGRIDLAIGRGGGTDPAGQRALRRGHPPPGPEDFGDQLDELLGYLGGSPSGRGHDLLAGPAGGPDWPEIWLLGSSTQSAVLAAELGLPYAFGDFFTAHGPGFVEVYRERFKPSPRCPEPYVMVGAMVMCAETDEEAERLVTSRYMAMSLLEAGRQVPLPPVETALRYVAEHPADPENLLGRRGAVGSPATVREELERLVTAYGADELLAVTLVYDHDARRRSYQLLAEAFELEQPARAPRLDPAAAG